MRVVRGRHEDRAADRRATEDLVERVARTGESAVRVWRPPRQVAFGRRDTRAEQYDRAVTAARERGFEPVERRVGGRAVAYTGTTLAFVRVAPTDGARTDIAHRYETALADLRASLAALGVETERGEPDRTFCPGSHSLRAGGRKLVGLAQRVAGGTATVGGQLVVHDHAQIGAVLDPVYDALGVPFDPATVGSVAWAGGATDRERVRNAVERALLDGRDPDVDRVGGG